MVEEYPDEVRNDVVEDEDEGAEPAPEDGESPDPDEPEDRV